MTPNELIVQLATHQGPCMRFCAYCPDDFNTADVKACVEEMQRQLYVKQGCIDDLLKELVKIRIAYKEATGIEYQDLSD